MKNIMRLVFVSLLLVACGSGGGSTPVIPVNPPPAPGYAHQRGFKKPPGHGLHAGAPFTLPTPAEIPISFNWENNGFNIPVGNQGSCGDCWAWSTVENFEYALAIFKGQNLALSVQEMTSENFSGCGGGDFGGSWEVSNGLILDSACPFTGGDGSCSAPLSPPAAQAVSVVNIGTDGANPTTAQVQQAILEYGPQSVDVAADGGWDNYSGGVLSSCGSSDINHMVLIVGWDGKGNWIVRNSWGASWGQNGDIILPYGCDAVASDVATVLVQSQAQYQQHPIPKKGKRK